jgi:hypothetical protein
MPTALADNDSGLEARYANFFKVGQNATEFLFQFGQFHSGTDLVWITRIVISPPFMKELLRMVDESVRAYEALFGEIRIPASEEGVQGEQGSDER